MCRIEFGPGFLIPGPNHGVKLRSYRPPNSERGVPASDDAGEAGAGVTAGKSGIEIDRGTAANYQFIFNETQDNFRVGEIGSLQAVATREDTPTDGTIPFWDAGNVRLSTGGSPFVKAGTAGRIFNNGILSLQTTDKGIAVFDGSGDDPQISLQSDAFEEVGKVWISNDSLFLDAGINTAGGESINFRAWTGSAYDNIFRGVQGGAVHLYYNGSAVASTTASGITGAVWG